MFVMDENKGQLVEMFLAGEAEINRMKAAIQSVCSKTLSVMESRDCCTFADIEFPAIDGYIWKIVRLSEGPYAGPLELRLTRDDRCIYRFNTKSDRNPFSNGLGPWQSVVEPTYRALESLLEHALTSNAVHRELYAYFAAADQK